MTLPQEDPAILLLITDNHRARLLSCERLRTGHVHVTPRATLREQWDEELHREQTSRASAAGHSYENIGHKAEERSSRFAREIASWLERELPKHTFDRLFLFAAPRVLGSLRREAPAALQQNWIEHSTDIAGLTEGELAQHPEIAALVPAVQH